MEYLKLQQNYLKRGLNDYILKSVEDFEIVFELKINGIKGYKELNDKRRNTFNQFLINYLNGVGLNSKASFIPVSIYYVEEIALAGKESEEEEYFTEYSMQYYILHPTGKREKMRNKGYIDKEVDYPIIKEYKKQFLRFDYKEHKRNCWLHVMSQNEWY